MLAGHENGVSARNQRHFYDYRRRGGAGGRNKEGAHRRLHGKELVDRADELLNFAGARSRNEFVAEAVKFYIGYLYSRKAENYLLQTLSSVLTGTVHDSENRLARMDFKLAVELSKLAHVIAYSHDVDEEALHRLHVKCVEEVKRINGAIEFEDAYRYQKREV